MNEIFERPFREAEARPYKYADVRTLSHAWKEALFGPPKPKPIVVPPTRTTFATSHPQAEAPVAAETHAAAQAPCETASGAPPETVAVDRRKSYAHGGNRANDDVRQSESTRVAQAPRAARQHGSERYQTNLESGEGEQRVRMLIQQHGSDIRLTAVSPGELSANVTASLEAVRRELAGRGIRVAVDHRIEQQTLSVNGEEEQA